MKFEYYNPVRFIFGDDALARIPALCCGHKVLLVYGGGSIKRNGVYETITKQLRDNAIPYVDYGNQTTATWQGILDGIALAKREKIDCVIEVGGASAMDTGKAIAFGAVHDGLEDYIEGRKQSDNRHLLNIIIPTYPSTGSEADGVCDIMEYKGYGTELFGAWPDYCLMDATATYSLDKKSTVYSALVCFIQASSYFLDNKQNDLGKGFAKTILQVLLDNCKRALDNPQDEQARSNILWASSVDTMGILGAGVESAYPWTLFSVGYIPRVIHGVSYREALAVAYPHWLRGIAAYHMDDVKRLMIEVFGGDPTLPEDALIEHGCAQWAALLQAGGIPQTLAAYGEAPTKEAIRASLAEVDFGEFSLEEMHHMVQACYQG